MNHAKHLIALTLILGATVCMAASKKTSEYPAKHVPAAADLFLLANDAANTNYHIRYDNLKSNVLATATNYTDIEVRAITNGNHLPDWSAVSPTGYVARAAGSVGIDFTNALGAVISLEPDATKETNFTFTIPPPISQIPELSTQLERGIIDVTKYGASTNLADNGPSFEAAFAALPKGHVWTRYTGGIILVPPGVYNFQTTAELPLAYAPNPGQAQFTVLQYGAQLKTTNAISIYKLWPADATVAGDVGSASWAFYGGEFIGTSITNQTGIQLGATFGSRIVDTRFTALDCGLDAYQCYGLTVNNSYGSANVTATWRVQGGTNWDTLLGWPGATLANSGANGTVFWRCRDSTSTGQNASIAVYQAQNLTVQDCILEGLNAQSLILDKNFEPWASFAGVHRFQGLYIEENPADAIIKAGLGTGQLIIDGLLYAGSSARLINATNCGLTSVLIENIPDVTYLTIGDASTHYSTNSTAVSGAGTNWVWEIRNWGSRPTIGYVDPPSPAATNLWVSGIIPRVFTHSERGSVSLSAPDGTHYKISVANDGTLSTTAE